eukprot:TRINITY_DN41814_c0_g2_i1.p2 TRINITY_DN41814_c0_g2~~TRINITY_DN41814_c0_g2_i1.p2  ORF type:complete len:120 (+),score=21.50 TRINITY_DN41814_c0_g2_i1:137-496(+)
MSPRRIGSNRRVMCKSFTEQVACTLEALQKARCCRLTGFVLAPRIAHMAIDNALRALDIDLPACPQILVQLSLLMHDEDANLQSIGGLIETDMALASAVEIGRAVQQECRDRSRMPSSA